MCLCVSTGVCNAFCDAQRHVDPPLLLPLSLPQLSVQLSHMREILPQTTSTTAQRVLVLHPLLPFLHTFSFLLPSLLTSLFFMVAWFVGRFVVVKLKWNKDNMIRNSPSHTHTLTSCTIFLVKSTRYPLFPPSSSSPSLSSSSSLNPSPRHKRSYNAAFASRACLERKKNPNQTWLPTVLK